MIVFGSDLLVLCMIRFISVCICVLSRLVVCIR